MVTPSAAEELTGGCYCGALRYRLPRSATFAGYACHCTDCQTRSGASCAVQLPFRTGVLALTGAPSAASHAMAGGRVVTHYFCPQCVTRLYSTSEQRPGFAILRAGTLDDSASFTPSFHIWTRSAPPWVKLPDDVPCLPGAPTPDEWPRLLAPRHP